MSKRAHIGIPTKTIFIVLTELSFVDGQWFDRWWQVGGDRIDPFPKLLLAMSEMTVVV